MAKRNPQVGIYELRDPNDGKTYYVGKSIHPRKRYLEHLADARARPQSAKGQWILHLLSQGKAPQLHVVNTVPFEDWIRAEAAAIREHFERKSPLTNVIMPRGTRAPKPAVYIRSQGYWDDLSPEYEGVKRRMFPFKHPEGYGLTVLFNMDDRGWRYGYDMFGEGGRYSFDHIVQPYKDGFPLGYRSLPDLVKSENWWELALLDTIFTVRPESSTRSFSYEEMSPVELFSPEQLGYWPTEERLEHVAR